MPLFLAKDRLFVKLATPNPEEFAFKVKVDMNQVVADELVGKSGLAYSTFDFSEKNRPTDDGWAPYVYTKAENADERHLWLYFMKPKTDDEMQVPFEEVSECDSHPWHPMLRKIKCRVDDKFPMATNVGDETRNTPHNYVSVDYVPEAEEGTRIVVKRFYGPRTHSIPQHRAPVATSVNWDIPGAQDFYRKCLHPAIGVLVTESGTLMKVGREATQYKGMPGAEYFPATVPERWLPYVFRDVQTQDSNGGWLREQWWAFPPRQPEEIQDKL